MYATSNLVTLDVQGGLHAALGRTQLRHDSKKEKQALQITQDMRENQKLHSKYIPRMNKI